MRSIRVHSRLETVRRTVRRRCLISRLITLSTIGYGDIVPVSGEARILAALEGVTGVLYIAITVAILVSKFRREPSD
jgi:Ion channel